MASRPESRVSSARSRTVSHSLELVVYRIADGRFPLFDGTGAALVGGRWNSPGRPVIYGSLSYAGAMLERLVHGGSARIPKTQCVILIAIPARVGKEIRGADRLPRVWYATDCLSARAFGDQWRAEQRSAVLIVPSVIAKYECNVVINPAHTDARWIVASKPEPVAWDVRLFARTRGRLGR